MPLNDADRQTVQEWIQRLNAPNTNIVAVWKAFGKYSSYKQPEGFCHAATQYWIAEMLSGTPPGTITSLLKEHADRVTTRQQNNLGRHNDIPGTTRQTIAERSFGRGQIRSRESLLDIVLDGNGGVFSYGFHGLLSRGHAVGFQMGDDAFRFFDPNSGTFTMPNPSQDLKLFIRAWFHVYWEWNYKRGYHNGSRQLVQYQRKPHSTLLDIRRDPWDFNPANPHAAL